MEDVVFPELIKDILIEPWYMDLSNYWKFISSSSQLDTLINDDLKEGIFRLEDYVFIILGDR